MGATWVATPNTRQHDAYYQRQYVEGLTRSGTSPNTLEQCQTDWQWFGRVGETLGRGWAMGALPIGHIGFWLAKSNVGVWPCGGKITGVISRLRARDRKSWSRLGNWAVRRPSCNTPAGHCKRITGACVSFFTSLIRQTVNFQNGLPSAWRRCPPTDGIRAGGRRRRQLAGLAAEGQADMSKRTVVQRCYHPWLEVARWARNQLRVS